MEYNTDIINSINILLEDLNSSKYEIVEKGGKYEIIPKELKYPVNYNGCCKVLGLGIKNAFLFGECNSSFTEAENNFVAGLVILKRCRDAYWKIAGDELGLNRPWEPDWCDPDQPKYCIYFKNESMCKSRAATIKHFLAFPTVELCKFFATTFENHIVQCKEFL